MIIVPDSNIWLGELGLNSPLGAATRFYVRHNNARLALPEVVRLEVEHNFRTRLKEFTKTISDNHRQLLVAFGTLKEVVLPTDAEIDRKAQDIFANVAVEGTQPPDSLGGHVDPWGPYAPRSLIAARHTLQRSGSSAPSAEGGSLPGVVVGSRLVLHARPPWLPSS